MAGKGRCLSRRCRPRDCCGFSCELWEGVCAWGELREAAAALCWRVGGVPLRCAGGARALRRASEGPRDTEPPRLPARSSACHSRLDYRGCNSRISLAAAVCKKSTTTSAPMRVAAPIPTVLLRNVTALSGGLGASELDGGQVGRAEKRWGAVDSVLYVAVNVQRVCVC